MNLVIDAISKVSPFIGSMMGGPVGGLVGALVSKTLGGIDMTDPVKVVAALQNNPEAERKLKELELQLHDLQGAREEAAKETGIGKLVRPILALVCMVAIIFDLYAIDYVENQLVQQVLVVMLVVLVWDVRQIYKFYFGSGEELPNLPFIKKR